MTVFRGAPQEHDAPRGAAPGAWITEIVEAQHRIRDAGVHPVLLLDELVASVSWIVDAPTRVVLVEDGVLTCRAASRDIRDLIGQTVRAEGTLCGEVVASGKPCRVWDLSASTTDERRLGFGSGRSMLAVPMVHEGVVMGVVVLTADQPGWFGPADEEAAAHLAGAAAAALTVVRARFGDENLKRHLVKRDRGAGVSTEDIAPRAPGINTSAAPDDAVPRTSGAGLAGRNNVATRSSRTLGRVADRGNLPAPGQPSDPGLSPPTVAGVPPVVEAPPPVPVPGGGNGVVDLTAWPPESGAGAVWLVNHTGLRAARELTGLGLWEWQPDSGRLLWSPEMYHFVGRTPGGPEPTLDAWHQCIHPEDLDRARRLDLHATHQETGAVESLRVIGQDGVERHLRCWSIVVAEEEGRPRSVCGAVVDVTRQMNDRLLLEKLSATDAITGLDNRLAFDRRMRELLSDPTRDVALLLLDLDRFKMVNDSLGHRVGDRLLVEVARRLNEVVPEGSITARMGGDEFVIVPRPGLGWLQVRRLAQSVVDSLRTPFVLPESGEMLVCPASVGVTSTSGRQVGVTDLLREADLALYRAKDSGRDRYIVFDDVLRARAQSRHRAERQLRQALEEGRLVQQYQPIVDFTNGRIVGAEALVRLRDGNSDRLLGPDEFVDVAEDTGLIVEVDCWVIDTAIAQIRAWGESLAPGERGPWLAVNVSPRSMEHPQVIRRILDAVKQGRIPRHRIKVELTEHSFLGTLPGGESSLRQLLGSGIPVGIDDFGTGYSALAYLQRFELDFMKIDKSFVASVGQEERADAVVTAIVDLAHAHGMLVTAEGVETPRQARRLREIGCDFAQGFHFGRPGEAAKILRG